MSKQGVPPPNYTQLPNIILDLMSEMSECEFRVTMAIARKTFGWHKDKDKLSLSQLKKITGLSKQGVIDGIQQGEERGIIEREAVDSNNPNKGFYYNLVVQMVDKEEGVVNVVDKGSQRSGQAPMPELVNEVDTQKKEKETLLNKKEALPLPSQSKNKKTSTPPHPFVTAYREEFRRSPNKQQIELLQQCPTEERATEVWSRILKDWALHGWNVTNVSGQLEKFKKDYKPTSSASTIRVVRIGNQDVRQIKKAGQWVPCPPEMNYGG